jgi:hypothetical protein
MAKAMLQAKSDLIPSVYTPSHIPFIKGVHLPEHDAQLYQFCLSIIESTMKILKILLDFLPLLTSHSYLSLHIPHGTNARRFALP